MPKGRLRCFPGDRHALGKINEPSQTLTGSSGSSVLFCFKCFPARNPRYVSAQSSVALARDKGLRCFVGVAMPSLSMRKAM